MKKLSIIIPVYNCNSYTDMLLDILNPQVKDRDDVEVLIVDDGSKTPYETEYDWAIIIRQKNGGASVARNTGLDNATGQYISFIDGDDNVSEKYVSYIIDKIDKEKFDYCYLSWDSFGGWNTQTIIRSVNDEFPGWNLCVWNRIYKRSVIGDIRFNPKKLIAEDAEFIHSVQTTGLKKSFISTIMYHYRSDTPESLTKRFAQGKLNTKRVVFNYNHITADMQWLLEDIIKTNEDSECIVMTNKCDIPEIYKYAMVMKPTTVKGTELRGEPTNLYQNIQLPIKTNLLIYTAKTFELGGIETFIWNMCNSLKDDIDVCVMYDQIDSVQLSRLEKIVRCIHRDPNQTIITDVLLINRITDIAPANVQYNKKVQMVHCCKLDNRWHVPQNVDVIVPVSNTVRKTYPGEFPEDKTQIIYNLTYPTKPSPVLHLVTATRTTWEKGTNKLCKLARALNNHGIKFVWTIFSDANIGNIEPGMVMMKPTLDVDDYIAAADYLVSLSDSEAFGYSIVEALELGTPVLTTPIDVLDELGFVEGKHGYIIPFDIDEEKIDYSSIIKKCKKFTYKRDNATTKKQWLDIIGEVESTHDYKYDPNIQVKIIRKYYDMQFDKHINVGEIINVTKDRAEQLIKANVAKRI